VLRYIVLVFSFIFANECIVCHRDKESKCKNNIHYTLQNEISLTLKAWGVKDYNKSLQTLPKISNHPIKEPKDLAIDFLRRKCLRCHLTSKEVNPTNNLCLACHNSHLNKEDSYRAKATSKHCLKCHNANFIGTDYFGLFPKDFDKSYKAPITKEGFYPKKEYRNSYHHLIEDVHFQKGMSCIDCHKMNKKASCTSCHTNLSQKNHPSYHKNISCIACHSAWQVNSYRSVILRSDIPNYKDFKRLISSEDRYLEEFLKKALKKPSTKPVMPDFIENRLYKGVWYLGYYFRRWERFFLINYRGKIELARPLLDFELTYIDEQNRTIIDAKRFGGFVVAKPHTIIKEAKSCEMCHLNPLNLNDKTTIRFNTLKGELVEGEELTPAQIRKLNSYKYKLERAKELF